MAGAVERVSKAGQDKWTPEQIIAQIKFDEYGARVWTPEVAAYIEDMYGVTVEEFSIAAAEWFLAKYEDIL